MNLKETNQIILILNHTKRNHTLRVRLPLDQYLSNASKMLANWSIDRTKNEKKFQVDINVDDRLYEIAYSWLIEKCCIHKITTQDFYIVNKVKNKHLIQNFVNSVLYGHNNLIFDDLAQVIKKVFMVNLS